tara:strand:+ start:6915 stop:7310 length:396 start_codon:yes stop_codon:yes gene_type:complete
MTYSALCFFSKDVTDIKDIATLLKQGPLSHWRTNRNLTPMKLTHERATFFLYIEKTNNVSKNEVPKIIDALETSGRKSEVSLVQNSQTFLKVWFPDPDEDMIYFNDFLLLIEQLENAFGGVMWNWKAQELM